jgi:hypothetical protein
MAATRRLPIVGGHEDGLAATARTDTWWLAPLGTFLGFSAFIAYANWALFQASHYYVKPYLSPFYSPLLWVDSDQPGTTGAIDHAWFGEWNDAWWPDFLPFAFSPAMLILVFPLSFRFTCYYYRKAYYRAFVGSPPACAVKPLPGHKYKGETTYLLIQNLHRYALYAAIVFIGLLSYDAVHAYFRDGVFGVGVGSIVLTLVPVTLGLYTFGCHSFRHLIGGGTDCMSCGEQTVKYGLWKKVSWLNGRHGIFAWVSLIWVAFADVYVRLVSMGVIRDLNTWDM